MQRTFSEINSTHLPASTANNTYKELKFSNKKTQFTKPYLASISKHKLLWIQFTVLKLTIWTWSVQIVVYCKAYNANK